MENSDELLGRKEFLETKVHGAISSQNNPTASLRTWRSAVVQEKSPINTHNIDVDRVVRLGNNKYDR
jgi:hypothetical protein